MAPAQIKSVSLFFFYSLLDEDLAEKASKDVIDHLRSKLKGKNEKGPTNPNVVLIHECLKSYNAIKATQPLNRASLAQKTKYILAPGVNLGAWRQFHKEAPEDEFMAVIWSQVVGFDEVLISQGLGVSEGTIRYRVGRGLRQLGQLLGWGDRLA